MKGTKIRDERYKDPGKVQKSGMKPDLFNNLLLLYAVSHRNGHERYRNPG
jgi:hypothetical protein